MGLLMPPDDLKAAMEVIMRDYGSIGAFVEAHPDPDDEHERIVAALNAVTDASRAALDAGATSSQITAALDLDDVCPPGYVENIDSGPRFVREVHAEDCDMDDDCSCGATWREHEQHG